MTAPINLNSEVKYPVDSTYTVTTAARAEGTASSGVSVRSVDRVTLDKEEGQAG